MLDVQKLRYFCIEAITGFVRPETQDIHGSDINDPPSDEFVRASRKDTDYFFDFGVC